MCSHSFVMRALLVLLFTHLFFQEDSLIVIAGVRRRRYRLHCDLRQTVGKNAKMYCNIPDCHKQAVTR